MEGPYHEFYLLPGGLERHADYGKWINAPGGVSIADDLLGYLYDSLEWIPTINPSNPGEWRGHGINRWGPTLIDHTGADVARRVFAAWASLFSAGPPELELQGPWTRWPDGSEGYTRLVVERDGWVERLRTLAGYASQCIGKEACILHIGV